MIDSTTLTPNFKMCKNGTACIHPDGPALPYSEFYTRKGMKDGYETMCKACKRADSKLHHPKPRGVASYKSEQRVIDKLRSIGIYASPGKRGEWKHIDVLAWGCVRVEVKTAKDCDGQFNFSLGHKSTERFLAHDVVILVCLHKNAEPTFHVFLSSDSVFYKDGHLKNGVTFQPSRKQEKKNSYAKLTDELMAEHQSKFTLIELIRLRKQAEMMDHNGALDVKTAVQPPVETAKAA